MESDRKKEVNETFEVWEEFIAQVGMISECVRNGIDGLARKSGINVDDQFELHQEVMRCCCRSWKRIPRARGQGRYLVTVINRCRYEQIGPERPDVLIEVRNGTNIKEIIPIGRMTFEKKRSTESTHVFTGKLRGMFLEDVDSDERVLRVVPLFKGFSMPPLSDEADDVNEYFIERIPDVSAESAIRLKAEAEIVQTTLQKDHPLGCSALYLYEVEGMSMRAVGRKLGPAPQTCKKAIDRLKKDARKRFPDFYANK